MADFKSVNRYELQKAFALAHRAQKNYVYDSSTREVFRAIAWQIWKACGEHGDYGDRNPSILNSSLELEGIASVAQAEARARGKR